MTSAAFSRDGESVVTSGDSEGVSVWNVADGERTTRLRGHTARVWTSEFSPDTDLVATASEDGTARIWDTASGEQSAVLRGHGRDSKRADLRYV